MTNLIEYDAASPEVRAIYDDIMASRKTDYINNIWKALANHPPALRKTWEHLKAVMGEPGMIDPLTRELIYIAVSVTNNCQYCIGTHSASARDKGMTDAMFGELLSIVGLANETNRLANGYNVPLDEKYR